MADYYTPLEELLRIEKPSLPEQFLILFKIDEARIAKLEAKIKELEKKNELD